jgi:hypothetical protein
MESQGVLAYRLNTPELESTLALILLLYRLRIETETEPPDVIS